MTEIRLLCAAMSLWLLAAVLPACAVAGEPGATSPPSRDLSDHTLYMVGHSHIDVAWRWQWPETIGVCRDTFGQAIKLMADYPDFRYTQSQAVLYAAIEENYPELFAAIRKQVAAGRWDIVGGMWVEPDVNMSGGEALVRQCLYGQRYFRRKFGVEAHTGWLPDTFGMAWTLPQILKQSHMDRLAFSKFPFGPAPWLTWTGPDGTGIQLYNARSVYARLLPALGGTRDLTQLPRAGLAVDQAFSGKALMLPYGVGDHGGGPTRRDIERFHALANLPDMPKVKLASADEGLAAITAQIPAPPVWRDEVNYFHRGCYTSQAEMKRHNRECETLLPNAEKFAVMAQLTGGFTYPRESLAKAWRGVLFNQFHDILPGSSIGPVFADATALYRDVETAAGDALESALTVLAKRADTQGDGDAVIVFNPLPWPRTDIAEVTLDYDVAPQHVTVQDAAGSRWAAQVAASKRVYGAFSRCQVIFAAREVPPLGFKVFWVRRAEQAPESGLTTGDKWLESQRFRIELDPKTGHVISVRDKTLGRELLAGGAHANVLRLLGDRAPDHTAWEIKYTGEAAELAQPAYVGVVERGPVRAAIQVGYERNGSVYRQLVCLYDDLDRIDFPTTIDWRERHTLLKACFPLAVNADSFAREIPFGNINHESNGDEVPAQKWVDVSDADWGVSLLNNCKYGHSVRGNEMTITLLRSPTDPDPVADLGRHTMSYSLYPHAGGWRSAATQRRAEELNAPLLARAAPKHAGPLGAQHTMLAVAPDDVFLAAAKPCEDSNDLLVRIWEAHGQTVRAEIALPKRPRAVAEVDLLEDEVRPPRGTAPTWTVPDAAADAQSSARLVATLKPYQIRSFRVRW